MKILKANSIVEEELFISLKRCQKCGGTLEVKERGFFTDEENRYDNVTAACVLCEKYYPFNFLCNSPDGNKIMSPEDIRKFNEKHSELLARNNNDTLPDEDESIEEKVNNTGDDFKPYIINNNAGVSELITAAEFVKLGLYFWEILRKGHRGFDEERIDYLYNISINSL